MTDPGLTVVIPAYNEEAAIERVVSAWKRELERLGIDCEMWVCDDGSRDRTAEILDDLARRYNNVRVASQPNQGHGPTITRGYREAEGDWVLQVDGDDEIGPETFEALWNCRDEFDLLLGYRVGRSQTWARKVMSAGSRYVVRALFGTGIRDPNVPYRLVRREILDQHLAMIPAGTFAPNLVLSGLALVAGLRVHQVPVQVGARLGGSPSLRRLQLLTAAWKSSRETLVVWWRSRHMGKVQ